MAGGNPLMPPGGAQGLVASAGPALTGDAGGSGGGLQQLASPQNAVSGGPGPTLPTGGGPDGPAPAPQGKGPLADLEQSHAYAKSVYNQVSRARMLLDHMRREMDQLVRKGDTVALEDVIAAAGRVVGHGAGAKDMATILSSMPPIGGQGLASWLQMHDASIRQQEAYVNQAMNVVAHRYGVSGMALVAGVHLADDARKKMIAAGTLGPRPPGAGVSTSPRSVVGEAGTNPLAPQGGGGM